MKKTFIIFIVLLSAVLLYFAAWPVPMEPISWNAPKDKGYTGVFKPNNRLKDIELLPMGNNHGPEDLAIDQKGQIYASTNEGNIVKLKIDGKGFEVWAKTTGRPLGIEFDLNGNLIAADGFQGLLSISTDKKTTILADRADEIPIGFANDLDIADDGKIYFSDVSTKLGTLPKGTKNAAYLDLLEHGGHGRLLCYDPVTKQTTALLSNLNYANGVAVSHDQQYVLVSETGAYRIIKYWIAGPKKGKSEPFIENLPGFPDNISAGQNNLFWLAFFAPRNALLDKLSDKPFWRKVIFRMPDFLKPQPDIRGHIVALDQNGNVKINLQDPKTTYPQNTSVLETDRYLYIGNLAASVTARLSKKKADL